MFKFLTLAGFMLPKILLCFWEDLFQSHLFGQRGFIVCTVYTGPAYVCVDYLYFEEHRM